MLTSVAASAMVFMEMGSKDSGLSIARREDDFFRVPGEGKNNAKIMSCIAGCEKGIALSICDCKRMKSREY